MGAGQLPGRARHLDPSRLCRGVRLRAQQAGKAHGRRRDRDHPAAAAPSRPVGRDDPRPPSRLHLPGNLRRQHRQAGRQLPAAGRRAGGAAREGAAWLQGLLRCGRCGRLMQVAYHSSGSPAYRCGRANQMYGARTCQRVGGRRLHETVLAELLAALAPACLAATVQAMSDTEAQFRQNLAVFERALERARFEAGRALPPVRQRGAGEPAGRQDPGGRPGRQAHGRAHRGKPARRPAGPPARHPHPGGNRLDHHRRSRPAGHLPGPGHHQRPAQGTHPRRHHRGHRHRAGQHRRGRHRPDVPGPDHLARRRQHPAADADARQRPATAASPAKTPST